jgi:hypothetical protein
MSEEEDLPRAYERYTPAQLVSEARRYLEEARRERDLRQRAEKGHLAATLAVNAIILRRELPWPRSLQARSKALSKVGRELRRLYDGLVESLHRRCFYDGICDPEIIEEDLEDVEGLIRRAEREIAEVEHE